MLNNNLLFCICNFFFKCMSSNKTNSLRPFLFAVLILLFHSSYSQEAIKKDSIPELALNTTTIAEDERKKDMSKEIIDKKKTTSNIKNSLTKREIFIEKGRNSFKFKYGGRIQTRYDVAKVQEPSAKVEDRLYFRRVRFKSDGHLFTPKFGYKLEIDIIGTQVLDAYLKYNFYKNLEI